jgi:hypothetical protein
MKGTQFKELKPSTFARVIFFLSFMHQAFFTFSQLPGNKLNYLIVNL